MLKKDYEIWEIWILNFMAEKSRTYKILQVIYHQIYKEIFIYIPVLN